jgi:hypothetical protein
MSYNSNVSILDTMQTHEMGVEMVSSRLSMFHQQPSIHEECLQICDILISSPLSKLHYEEVSPWTQPYTHAEGLLSINPPVSDEEGDVADLATHLVSMTIMKKRKEGRKLHDAPVFVPFGLTDVAHLQDESGSGGSEQSTSASGNLGGTGGELR